MKSKSFFWRRLFTPGIVLYVTAFFISLLTAVLLLLIASAFPASRVNNHVKESAVVMASEGDYPALSDRSDASVLDNFTDAIMLMECQSTTILQPNTILTNPKFIYEDTAVLSLLQYSENNDEAPTSYYSRYWMGFRSVLRVVLCFLTYQEIKLYNAILFFVLFFSATLCLAKHTNTKAAMMFAISIILVRPHIICNSLQFSNCFIIAFIAMLLVPFISKHHELKNLYFMEIGIATMYFDFYTTPVITFALPAIFLLLLNNTRKAMNLKSICIQFVFWFIGYILMWIAKLLLVEIFTAEAGLATGLSAMGSWSINSSMNPNTSGISLPFAFFRVISAIVADFEGVCIWGCAGISLLIYILCTKKNRKRIACNMKHNGALLVFIGLVILWFVVTFKPLAIHYYFQYRSIVVVFWSFFLYLFHSSTIGEKANCISQTTKECRIQKVQENETHMI